MYHDKEKLATLLYQSFDGLILENADIDELLTPQQKYQLIMEIINVLPKTDHEKVIEFNETFKVEKEVTTDVLKFKYAELRFRLLLEEILELGFALGLNTGTIYQIYIEIQDKVRKKSIVPSLVEVLDALTDINYVSYGAFNVFNLDDIAWEAMENVHDSNMSKLIPKSISQDNFIEIVKELTKDGTEIISEEVNRGIVIRNKQTGKVLKPKTYKPATLNNLLKTYLDEKNK